MNQKLSSENILNIKEKKTKAAFNVFCLWTIVLLFRPQDLFPFLMPLRPALVVSAVALATVIASYKYLPGSPLLQNSQIKKYLLLYAVMIAGIPFSLYARLSFERVLTEYIVTVVFVCIFFKLLSSIERLNKFLLTSCLGSGLYFLSALREFTPGSGRLAFGTMFDPNDLAYFALGFLPLNLLFISKDNPLWVRLACLGAFSSGLMLILFTGSRGGFIGLCISILVLLFFTSKTLNRMLKIFFVIAFVLVFSVTAVNTERYLTIFSLEQDYNVQAETGRLGLWKIGLRSLRTDPLLGVGVGNFPFAVGLDRQRRGLGSARWQAPHNSIIQISTETGLVGLVLYLIMSLNIVRIFYKALKNVESEWIVKVGEVGLVGFSGMLFASMFVSQAYSTYWAFYLALSAVVSQEFDLETSIIK